MFSYMLSGLGIQNIHSSWVEMIPACNTVGELNFQIYFIKHNLEKTEYRWKLMFSGSHMEEMGT